MSRLVHIASLVVHHREDACAVIDTLLGERRDAELALRERNRSIVLCEADSDSALMQVVDALQALPGIHAVNLVHHHAEDAESLDQEISP
ncbi:chaperone NapD [Pseudomarimonas salicorniae]|uniref:Chaperone NapD n=1 Tax=Pseudomarimonas salicorniae TaxID=2933270 RepID=A0ABT0GDR4_9GAMM|nr:chaperone NapD [Lysobacter sp. CAU 1642]MCK7592673.1 chaperone NapD [Lysobacter sp. CAU 1642]